MTHGVSDRIAWRGKQDSRSREGIAGRARKIAGMLNAIVTLGPATSDAATMEALLDVAAAFRLNASHVTGAELGEWLRRIAEVLAERGRDIPVYVDLQGAKMRIGHYEAREGLPPRVRFMPGVESDAPECIPVPHAIFFEAVQPGDTITLNDARVSIRIDDVERGGPSPRAWGRVVRDGPLSSHKGINRQEHPLPCPSLNDQDREAVAVAMGWPFTRFAFSFVVDGSEAGLLRPLVGRRPMVAKIERPEAFPHLEEIAAAFDELWLCRGDLGAQAGLARLGAMQEEFVQRCRGLGRPYVLAGQVLEHMTHFPNPTRTEVVHLYQAERAGFSGFVLSDETAVGRYPLEVARLLHLIRGHHTN